MALDNILLNTSLTLPEHLRLPLGCGDPNIVFMNMCLHTSTICLHQAAIFKAEKHRSLAKVSAESKMRCIAAAGEIANIMKLSSFQDMSGVSRDSIRSTIYYLTFENRPIPSPASAYMSLPVSSSST